MKATKSELRSANDRIKSLQRSLAGEGDDESDNYDSDDKDGSDMADSDGSYQIGQYATTDDDFDNDEDGDQDRNGVSEYSEARRKRKEVIDELMNDSVDGLQVGKSRKRIDELLDSDDSPLVKSKSSPKVTKRDLPTGSNDDTPVLGNRVKNILEDGSDVEDVPAIKPRKTLEELLKSDSDSEHEDL